MPKERKLEQFVERVREEIGDGLEAIAVTGGGVRLAAGETPVVVVGTTHPEVLRVLAGICSSWNFRDLPTPLLFDLDYLENSRDVFPIELHELCDNYRILHGRDVFRDLDIDDRHLRYQCEHEARGKLLRLQELYLEAGGKQRRLRELLMDATGTFLIVMRNFLRLGGRTPPEDPAEILEALREEHGIALPVFKGVALAARENSWPDGTVDEVFMAYRKEIAEFVRLVDGIFRSAG